MVLTLPSETILVTVRTYICVILDTNIGIKNRMTKKYNLSQLDIIDIVLNTL